MSPDYAIRLTGFSNIHLRKLDQVPKKSHNNTSSKRTNLFLDHICTHLEASLGFLIKTKMKADTKLLKCGDRILIKDRDCPCLLPGVI